jgi:large subunit ribosomal protein L12
MEYVYAAAILHELGQEINEQNVTAVLEAAGADVSESQVKALIAALEGVDLDQIVGSAQPALPEDGAEAAPAGEVEAADNGQASGQSDLPETAEDDGDSDSGGSLSNIFGSSDDSE